MNRALFERHPKTTLVLLLLGVFVLFDLVLGYWFCPKVVGEPDSYYHHDLPHSFTGEKEWGPLRYRLQTNALGFKDDQTGDIPLRAAKPRILILGDSFTEGVGFPHEETFSAQFEQNLRQRGVDVDVQNAGVLSYSPKLYYYKTKYLLYNVGLHIDELVVFLDMSDIQDEVRYVAFTPTGDFGITSSFLLRRADTTLKRVSFSYYSLRGLLLGSTEQEAAVAPLENLAIRDQEFLDNWSIDRIRWAFDDELYRKWGVQGIELAQDYMDRLFRLCQENGIRMTVAIYPWPRQIMERKGIDRHVDIWERFCREHGLPLLNYFPGFIDDEEPMVVLRRYYIPGDVHWNREGHRFVAERLAKNYLQRANRQ